ncbi:hypothetical protein M409DRAFT_68964 [Zasmidium cellare ATCC 36951]|uniref:Gem-associated protein 5 TPR domain-containing protein n=1 Tax=Zasmidium cellare ATCC 36951 TaxID=1080233 RepID=A0A6A6C666_ZASCE|nr:uncharacterized protein M409DRAFT_68964 [Zasmidium cellare ATCC 36951]KAF2162667.1 hypothetical protein M409DRAFT_68964 [Zasmidium cellare ATCC 36951]
MSTRQVSRQRSTSTRSSTSHHSAPHSTHSASRRSGQVRQTPPPTAFTPENTDQEFEPCAATASFLLYAQRNRILVLHHDTLTIERRLDLHREDVLWIVVDNVSERGSGRLAVSFDAGKTAIVWDILSGGEVARFSAYEHMKVAAFMRNGNIAFGNDQGNIILFEPSTSEHISARTIFDPITAIAPAADCSAFAIGYLNGSILIATLQPSFTILHTLNTNRAPSKITGLAWHGSSSKQKTDMLATQTYDGDLRVWSVPKEQTDTPNIIRVLQRSETPQPGACWFAWSKNGRLIQFVEGETRAWDVRTKKVTYDIIPTIDGVVGISNYGPSATLFTLGRNHTVQQYDINPSNVPLQVATAQHVPANAPPTPPTTLEERSKSAAVLGQTSLPGLTDEESSADESMNMSPLQKIAREMESLDALESEIRDKVMPLSSRSSNAGSLSSGGSGHAVRRQRKYLYDRPDSSRASNSTSFEGTEFSFGPPSKVGHESVSIRSQTQGSTHSRKRSSHLRKEVLRSPEEGREVSSMDLFPWVKARLREVAFRTPHYGEVARTPEILQREMLSVIFGWNDDVRTLVNEELAGHGAGSASGVLLSRWLGDIDADQMASLVGSESMTSSDWMLLALSSIGADSQKKVGEAFVQRLLEKGDIHPAAGILIGLGEVNDAIEVYVSQGFWLEAVLLTCLTRESDWQRISWLLRKWGEAAVLGGDAELAVRCFSCTSIETNAPWTSPRAQDAVHVAQREPRSQPASAGPVTSPTYSLPSRSGSGRLTAKNASLKLITSFGDKAAPIQQAPDEPLTTLDPATVTAGVTPIGGMSALPLSPAGRDPWRSNWVRSARDPTSARTATPGGYNRRKRLPSRGDIERAKQEAEMIITPLTAARDFGDANALLRTGVNKRSSSVGSVPEPATALRPTVYDATKLAPSTFGERADQLPSPAHGVFNRLREDSRASRDRKQDRLGIQVVDTVFTDEMSPSMERSGVIAQNRAGTLSPPLTGGSSKASTKSAKGSAKGRATDEYISSVDEARQTARKERTHSRQRGESRKRGESRSGRASSRMREASENRGRKGEVRYIKPAKRSPSSPVPMSPEEILQAQSRKVEPATTDDENFYKTGLGSPVESHKSARSGKSDPRLARKTVSEDKVKPTHPPRTSSKAPSMPTSPLNVLPEGDRRGRSDERTIGSSTRSPSSPLPTLSNKVYAADKEETQSDGQRFRLRSQSANRRLPEDLQDRRQASRDRRDRSSSRRRRKEDPDMRSTDVVQQVIPEEGSLPQASLASENSSMSERSGMSKKELAAKELEERRLSLARRRPSAPQIPRPGEFPAAVAGTQRPSIGQRSQTDLGDSPTSFMPPMSRAHTVDADSMNKYGLVGKITGTSTPSAPIGLPATPRAMRHPKYMGSDSSDGNAIPNVPDIPGKFSDLSLSGSNLSQITGSMVSGVSSSMVSTNPRQSTHISGPSTQQSETGDSLGPLLPSSVFSKGSGPRSASAPPDNSSSSGSSSNSVPMHPGYKAAPSHSRRLSNIRKISPPDLANPSETSDSVTSIDAALHGSDTSNVIVIPETPHNTQAPVLPELLHLAGPPPPPPPPTMFSPTHTKTGSGVIDIAIDQNAPTSAVETQAPQFPATNERSSTSSPTTHRRNQGSVGESFGARFRGLGERMRSSSKGRTKSPQMERGLSPYESIPLPTSAHPDRPPPQFPPVGPAPYESVPIPSATPTQQTGSRAQSPYEQAMAAMASGGGHRPSHPVPTSPGSERQLNETSIPPSSLPGSRNNSAMGGYRNPKEIRANMPPEAVQQGAWPHPNAGGFL